MPGNDSRYGRRSVLQGLAAFGGTVALGGVASGAPDFSGDSTELLAGRYYSKGSARSLSTSLARALPENARVVEEYDPIDVAKIEVATKDSLARTARSLEERLPVDFVEEDTEHRKFGPMLAEDPKFSEQYAPQQCNAPTGWEETLGSNDVTVSVVDQGIDYTHPGFEGRFGENKGNDFAGSDDDPAPVLGFLEFHGTHVGGIASATTRNGKSIAGMSNSKLLGARALGVFGTGATSDIADAIRWSAERGADIINLSLGGGGETETMRNAVQFAVDNGALPIAAAGNSGERGVSYPAAYEDAVAVSAVDDSEALADFSQYGPKIDVTAPGANVLSTVPGGDHRELSGTSMACPAASGVAALGAAAADGGLGPEELRSLLKSSARDVGLDDEKQGAGHVDAATIVEQA